MSYTNILDALDCCPDCYHDSGEIIPLAFPVRRNVDGTALCDQCADAWDADAKWEAEQTKAGAP